MRFLQEAARFGDLHVLLYSDELAAAIQGLPTKFPMAERGYLVRSVRYVAQLTVVHTWSDLAALPRELSLTPDIWVVDETQDTPGRGQFCDREGLDYRVLSDATLEGYPLPDVVSSAGGRPAPKVVVTGCYDWLHSGHVRFFEEASALGDLCVAVGNDANVRELKGEGHPLFSQDHRRYMVQSIRYVTSAVITKGMGWMDAAPNIDEIQPDIYVVNEDGDRPEKRAFCEARGLDYVVLKRTPKPGLRPRSSTDLRGF
jgi:cytidyltransferase-like protein